MSTSERLLRDLEEELGELEVGGVWVDCLKGLMKFVEQNRDRIDQSSGYRFGEYEEDERGFRSRIILDNGVIVYGVEGGRPFVRWEQP